MPNNYHATIEFISGVIRIYSEKRDDSVHNTGIPFLFSIYIRWINPEEVEIMGLSDKLTPSMWKTIAVELHKYGVNKVKFYRYKDGKKIEKLIPFKEKWLTGQNPGL